MGVTNDLPDLRPVECSRRMDCVPRRLPMLPRLIRMARMFSDMKTFSGIPFMRFESINEMNYEIRPCGRDAS
jgi:hypothetical protein